MFPATGVFSELLCPHEDRCSRSYCPFYHNPPGCGTSQPSMVQDVASTSQSASLSGFAGYVGYVTPANPSIYAPEDPSENGFTGYYAGYIGVEAKKDNAPPDALSDASVITAVEPTMNEMDETSRGSSRDDNCNETEKEEAQSPPPVPVSAMAPIKTSAKKAQKKDETQKLFKDYIKKVAEIDSQLETLQRQRDEAMMQACYSKTTKPPKKVSSSSSSSSSKSSGYVPTPLADLEKGRHKKNSTSETSTSMGHSLKRLRESPDEEDVALTMRNSVHVVPKEKVSGKM